MVRVMRYPGVYQSEGLTKGEWFVLGRKRTLAWNTRNVRRASPLSPPPASPVLLFYNLGESKSSCMMFSHHVIPVPSSLPLIEFLSHQIFSQNLPLAWTPYSVLDSLPLPRLPICARVPNLIPVFLFFRGGCAPRTTARADGRAGGAPFSWCMVF